MMLAVMEIFAVFVGNIVSAGQYLVFDFDFLKGNSFFSLIE
jgi:hypothetical protein